MIYTILATIAVIISFYLFISSSRYNRKLDIVAALFLVISCIHGLYVPNSRLVYLAIFIDALAFLIRHFEYIRRKSYKFNQLSYDVPIYRYDNLFNIDKNTDLHVGEFDTKLVSKDEHSLVFITKLEPSKEYPMYCSDFNKKFTVLKGGMRFYSKGEETILNKDDTKEILKYQNHYYIVSEKGCDLRVDCLNPNYE